MLRIAIMVAVAFLGIAGCRKPPQSIGDAEKNGRKNHSHDEPGKGHQQQNAKQPSPKFSADSFPETCSWLAKIAQDRDEWVGNKAAVSRQDSEIRKSLADLAGKTIKWAASVKSANATSGDGDKMDVTFQTVGSPQESSRFWALVGKGRDNEAKWPHIDVELEAKGVPESMAEKLKPDSTVTLSGKIECVLYKSTFGEWFKNDKPLFYYTFRVIVSDCAISSNSGGER